MDVNHFWPTDDEIESLLAQPTEAVWAHLFDLRQKTWNGFSAIEAEKGVVRPKVSISTSYGQEVLRIIMFRVLEEASEALLAEDSTHVQEELVDAMNYLMSLFLIDQEHGPGRGVLLSSFAEMTESISWGQEFNLSDLGFCTRLLGGVLSDRLRNRAWMNHAQDFYFSGWDVFHESLLTVAHILLAHFESFEAFLRVYIAKDGVLQFRLKSKY